MVYRSHQVIVPISLREEMLQKIHKAHQGADSSIRRAPESLFWPGMQTAIKEKCLSCGLCAQYVNERPQEPSDYTVTILNYIELDSLSGNTSANSVIRAMRRQFARHGISDELINRQWSSIRKSRVLKVCSRIRFHHSQIITILQPGKWESGVSS